MSLHHNTAFLSDIWSQRFKLPPGGKIVPLQLCFYWHGWTNFTLLKQIMIPSTHAFKFTSKLSNLHLTNLLFSHGKKKEGGVCRQLLHSNLNIFSSAPCVCLSDVFITQVWLQKQGVFLSCYHKFHPHGRHRHLHCTCMCGVLEENTFFYAYIPNY